MKVREEKNESPTRSVTTVKDVVVQYSTQQELDKVVALQVELYRIYLENYIFICKAEQISDASKVLGVVRIKHNY